MKGGLTALATSMVLAAAGAVAQPAGLAAAASGGNGTCDAKDASVANDFKAVC